MNAPQPNPHRDDQHRDDQQRAGRQPILTARNASLPDLVEVLRAQHAAKLDVVAPAADLHAQDGQLLVRGAGEPVLSHDGVTARDAQLRPTESADAGIAAKLGIPIAYLRRCRREQVGLYDANVNTWLDEAPQRRFLVRGLSDGAGGGVMRALLSDSFRIVDNLDVLLSVLAGLRDAGAAVDITAADLTESRMYVKIRSRDIAAQAPQLLGNYTSPFTGARGADNPVVFAGFLITNSETGQGKFKITPRLEVEVCANGLVLNQHALSEVHLGGRLADGVIRWSADTEAAALELVTKKARDAVAAFLDPSSSPRSSPRSSAARTSRSPTRPRRWSTSARRCGSPPPCRRRSWRTSSEAPTPPAAGCFRRSPAPRRPSPTPMPPTSSSSRDWRR